MNECKWEITGPFENVSDGVSKKYAVDGMPAANYEFYQQAVLDVLLEKTAVYLLSCSIGEVIKCQLPVVLSVKKIKGIKIKEFGFINHPHVNLCSMNLATKDIENSLENLIKAISGISEKWDRFVIRNIQASSNGKELLALDDEAYFDVYKKKIEEFVPAKQLRNLRRQEKKFVKDIGEVRFNRQYTQTALDDFIELEAASWKGDKGVAIKGDVKLEAFYQQLMDGQANVRPVIFELRSKEELISSAFGFYCNSKLFIHKISFSGKYSKYSLGNVLVKYIINDACENGLETVSFVTSPQWLLRWHPSKRRLSDLVIYNSTFSGCKVNFFVFLLAKIKKLRNTMMNKIKVWKF